MGVWGAAPLNFFKHFLLKFYVPNRTEQVFEKGLDIYFLSGFIRKKAFLRYKKLNG